MDILENDSYHRRPAEYKAWDPDALMQPGAGDTTQSPPMLRSGELLPSRPDGQRAARFRGVTSAGCNAFGTLRRGRRTAEEPATRRPTSAAGMPAADRVFYGSGLLPPCVPPKRKRPLSLRPPQVAKITGCSGRRQQSPGLGLRGPPFFLDARLLPSGHEVIHLAARTAAAALTHESMCAGLEHAPTPKPCEILRTVNAECRRRSSCRTSLVGLPALAVAFFT